ncbi:MAG: hypothetical protein ACYTXC_01285 [Nostoc sp.]
MKSQESTYGTILVCNLAEKAVTEGLSHKEKCELTSYSIKTIRNKASKRETIAARDGFTYRYDKDPKVLKWVKT